MFIISFRFLIIWWYWLKRN